MKSQILRQALKSFEQKIRQEKMLTRFVQKNYISKAALAQKELDKLRKQCRAVHLLYGKMRGLPPERVEKPSENAMKRNSTQLPAKYCVEAAENYLPYMADEIEIQSINLLKTSELLTKCMDEPSFAEMVHDIRTKEEIPAEAKI